MASTPLIGIVICTYNRADYVRSCLESLRSQMACGRQFSVLVVNNNSSDNTVSVAREFATIFPYFKLLTEARQGLSYARNRGYREADNEWVIYLYDDAKAAPHFIAQCYKTIESYDFPAFGGVFLPWYKFGRPIWYKDQYASNQLPYKNITELKGDEYACGGIMAFKKELLHRYQGFNTNIGMIGDKIGYAEETELQERMRRDGIKIGYNPDWLMYHVVAETKLSVDWFFKSNFAAGRDKVRGKRVAVHGAYLLLVFIVAIGLACVDALSNGLKLCFRKEYYIENWLIDSFRKTAKRFGIIYTALLDK